MPLTFLLDRYHQPGAPGELSTIESPDRPAGAVHLTCSPVLTTVKLTLKPDGVRVIVALAVPVELVAVTLTACVAVIDEGAV